MKPSIWQTGIKEICDQIKICRNICGIQQREVI